MKKGIFIICIISLMLIVGTIGCFEEEEKKGNNNDDTDDTTDQTYTWTIKELMQDYSTSFSNSGIKMVYDTLKDGDTLIIEDSIPENTTYNSTGDYTEIPFSLTIQGEDNTSSTTTLTTYITGNITDEFTPGTNFTMTVTIKHVNVTIQIQGQDTSIEMETFNEQWKSEEAFKTAYQKILSGENATLLDAFTAMPQSVIKKS